MGYGCALMAALLFGANGSVAKVVLGAGITPAQLTLFRSLSAALVGGAVLLATDRGALRVSRRELVNLAVLGIVGVALMQWFYAIAIDRLPVGIALLIEYTAVLMVAVVGRVFFAEEVKPRLWLAIGCVLVGLAVVAEIWSSDLPPVGIAVAGLAALAFAIYLLLGERLVTKTSPLAAAFWSMLFAALFWLAFSGWWNIDPATLTHRVSLGGHLSGTVLPVWALVGYVMALGSFLPFLLSFVAIGRLRATPAGIVATTEVVFGFAVAWLWLGEALDTAQLIGAFIVLAGVGVAQTARNTVQPAVALID
ncbi:MAG TPA: DMT family transporter [Jatrophihabitantaceae bacterium]|jgi:drug/metabolite transporter (DMT)-like permease